MEPAGVDKFLPRQQGVDDVDGKSGSTEQSPTLTKLQFDSVLSAHGPMWNAEGDPYSPPLARRGREPFFDRLQKVRIHTRRPAQDVAI